MNELTALAGVAPVLLLVALFVTFFAASVQSSFGFGFAICSVPFLSLVDPALAPAPQILLALPLSLSVLIADFRAVDWKGAGRILIGAMPGAALGALILTAGNHRVNDVAVAAIVLFAVLVIARGWKIPKKPATEVGAGALSASFSVICGVDGPPLALLYYSTPGPTLRATLALLFLVNGCLAIGVRAATGDMALSHLVVALACAPGLAAGLYVGRKYGTKLEARPLRMGVLVIASLSAAGLLVRAFA